MLWLYLHQVHMKPCPESGDRNLPCQNIKGYEPNALVYSLITSGKGPRTWRFFFGVYSNCRATRAVLHICPLRFLARLTRGVVSNGRFSIAGFGTRHHFCNWFLPVGYAALVMDSPSYWWQQSCTLRWQYCCLFWPLVSNGFERNVTILFCNPGFQTAVQTKEQQFRVLLHCRRALFRKSNRLRFGYGSKPHCAEVKYKTAPITRSHRRLQPRPQQLLLRLFFRRQFFVRALGSFMACSSSLSSALLWIWFCWTPTWSIVFLGCQYVLKNLFLRLDKYHCQSTTPHLMPDFLLHFLVRE